MQKSATMQRLRKKTSFLPNTKSPRVDFRDLKKICKLPIKDFHTYKGIGELKKIPTVVGPCYYKDNGAKILVVAHLDTVLSPHWAGVLTFKSDTFIYSTALDDRLGAYVALDMLQRAGIQYDILLTTNEEQGESSAGWFEPPEGKKYNWIVEFDRKGSDVVTYQYRDLDWHMALETVGFKVGHGTYSDIKDLDHLGVCAVNIGIGYQNNHLGNAYASLNTIRSQVSKFLDFYNNYSEIEFKFKPKLNSVTKHGLKFDPDVIGRFTDEELELAATYYEQLEKGATFASLGFPNATRITKQTMNVKRFLTEPKEKDKTGNKGSEDEQTVILFPAPLNPGAREAAAEMREKGYEAIIIEKCIDCGKHFKVNMPNTYPYCPKCQKIKDDLAEKEDEKLKLPPPLGPASSNDEALIKLALEWLEIKDAALPNRVGTALKMLREKGIKTETAKNIYDELVAKKIIKPFRISKKGQGKITSNYSIHPSGKVVLTQGGMARLMEKEGFDIKDTQQTSFSKWLSRAESGHNEFYAYPKEFGLYTLYIMLLNIFVKPEWVPVLEKLESTKEELKQFMRKLHTQIGIPRTTAKTTGKIEVEAKSEKILLKAKFALDVKVKDADGNRYNFSQKKGEDGSNDLIPVWNKVNKVKTDKKIVV